MDKKMIDGPMLPFTNYLIFGLVMRDKKICGELIKLILPNEQFNEIKLQKPLILSLLSSTSK